MTDKATHTPLPCPYCGAPAEIEEGSDHHGTWFNLGCSRHWGHQRNPDHTNTCIAGRIYYTETDVPLSEALIAWNTRAVNSHHDLIEALREARTGLSITRTNVMTEIGRCADESRSPWAGVPEQLAKRIAKIDAALKEAGRG